MKRFLPLILILAAACEPQTLTHHLQMRHASQSGLNLTGKTLAAVCMDSDSTLTLPIAEGFAAALEEDYFRGDPLMEIFNIPDTTISLGLARSLIMDTGADVVFIFSAEQPQELEIVSNNPSGLPCGPDSAFVANIKSPLELHLKVYDSLSKDVLHEFGGKTSCTVSVFNNGLVGDDALRADFHKNAREVLMQVGEQASAQFAPVWENESYSYYYFDSSDWYKATTYASKLEWRDAMKEWIPLLKTKNLEKRACLEYNIALASYMLGDPELALKWLKQSEQDQDLPLISSLRRRINDRMNEK